MKKAILRLSLTLSVALSILALTLGAVWAASDSTESQIIQTQASDSTVNAYLVKDFDTGAFSGNPNNLVPFGSNLLLDLHLYTDDHFALSKSISGTVTIDSIEALQPLGQFRNYYVYTTELSPTAHILWRAAQDGQDARMLVTLPSQPSSLIKTEQALYFITNGSFWKTDGTVNGTQKILELESWIDSLVFEGGYFYFYTTWYATPSTYFFYRSDGVDDTRLLMMSSATPRIISLPSGKAVIWAGEPDYSSYVGAVQDQIYLYDPVTEESQLIHTPTHQTYGDQHQTLLNGKIYYRAANELWVTDGTSQGTSLVKQFYSSGHYDRVQIFGVLDGMLFLSIETADSKQLWISDGTTIGTEIVFDVNLLRNAGANNYQRTGTVKRVGSWYYFSADDRTHGYELWRTNGTIFERIADIADGSDSSYPAEMTLWHGEVYFSAENATYGRELWAIPHDAPDLIGTPDFYFTKFAVPLTIESENGLLVNDYATIENYTLVVIDDPQHGALHVTAEGGFTYMPKSDFCDTDVFRYRLQGEGIMSDEITVEIKVDCSKVYLPTLNR